MGRNQNAVAPLESIVAEERADKERDAEEEQTRSEKGKGKGKQQAKDDDDEAEGTVDGATDQFEKDLEPESYADAGPPESSTSEGPSLFISKLEIFVHFMQVHAAFTQYQIDWPEVWSLYNPFSFVYKLFSMWRLEIPLSWGSLVERQDIKLFVAIMIFPLLWWIADSFWSNAYRWKEVYRKNFKTRLVGTLMLWVLVSSTTMIGSAFLYYVWRKDPAILTVAAGFVSFLTAIVLFRCVGLFIGKSLYLSERKIDIVNGRYDVPDDFFHSMRLNLRKLSLLLFLGIYLPVLNIFLHTINDYRTADSEKCTYTPWSCRKAVRAYLAGLFTLAYFIVLPILLLVQVHRRIKSLEENLDLEKLVVQQTMRSKKSNFSCTSSNLLCWAKPSFVQRKKTQKKEGKRKGGGKGRKGGEEREEDKKHMWLEGKDCSSTSFGNRKLMKQLQGAVRSTKNIRSHKRKPTKARSWCWCSCWCRKLTTHTRRGGKEEEKKKRRGEKERGRGTCCQRTQKKTSANVIRGFDCVTRDEVIALAEKRNETQAALERDREWGQRRVSRVRCCKRLCSILCSAVVSLRLCYTGRSKILRRQRKMLRRKVHLRDTMLLSHKLLQLAESVDASAILAISRVPKLIMSYLLPADTEIALTVLDFHDAYDPHKPPFQILNKRSIHQKYFNCFPSFSAKRDLSTQSAEEARILRKAGLLALALFNCVSSEFMGLEKSKRRTASTGWQFTQTVGKNRKREKGEGGKQGLKLEPIYIPHGRVKLVAKERQSTANRECGFWDVKFEPSTKTDEDKDEILAVAKQEEKRSFIKSLSVQSILKGETTERLLKAQGLPPHVKADDRNVAQCVAQSSRLAHATSKDGTSLMHIVAASAKVRNIFLLHDLGAELMQEDVHQITPLALAKLRQWLVSNSLLQIQMRRQKRWEVENKIFVQPPRPEQQGKTVLKDDRQAVGIEVAAVKIQSIWRKNQVVRIVKTLQRVAKAKAVCRIQSAWRIYFCRKYLLPMKRLEKYQADANTSVIFLSSAVNQKDILQQRIVQLHSLVKTNKEQSVQQRRFGEERYSRSTLKQRTGLTLKRTKEGNERENEKKKSGATTGKEKGRGRTEGSKGRRMSQKLQVTLFAQLSRHFGKMPGMNLQKAKDESNSDPFRRRVNSQRGKSLDMLWRNYDTDFFWWKFVTSILEKALLAIFLVFLTATKPGTSTSSCFNSTMSNSTIVNGTGCDLTLVANSSLSFNTSLSLIDSSSFSNSTSVSPKLKFNGGTLSMLCSGGVVFSMLCLLLFCQPYIEPEEDQMEFVARTTNLVLICCALALDQQHYLGARTPIVVTVLLYASNIFAFLFMLSCFDLKALWGEVGNFKQFVSNLQSEQTQRKKEKALKNSRDLYSACRREATKVVVEYLQDKHIDLSWMNPDENFWTAAHVASRHGSVKSLKLLVRAGANLITVDKDGQTPLHLAYKYGAMGCVQVLKQAGALINVKNTSGHMPQQLLGDNSVIKAAGDNRAEDLCLLVDLTVAQIREQVKDDDSSVNPTLGVFDVTKMKEGGWTVVPSESIIQLVAQTKVWESLVALLHHQVTGMKVFEAEKEFVNVSNASSLLNLSKCMLDNAGLGKVCSFVMSTLDESKGCPWKDWDLSINTLGSAKNSGIVSSAISRLADCLNNRVAIQALDLSHTEINDDDLKLLVGTLENNEHIRKLSLEGCTAISRFGKTILAAGIDQMLQNRLTASANPQGLEELVVDSKWAIREGATELNVSGSIGNEDLNLVLSTLRMHSTIRSVVLSDCKLSPTSVKVLATNLKSNKTVTALSLAGNAIAGKLDFTSSSAVAVNFSGIRELAILLTHPTAMIKTLDLSRAELGLAESEDDPPLGAVKAFLTRLLEWQKNKLDEAFGLAADAALSFAIDPSKSVAKIRASKAFQKMASRAHIMLEHGKSIDARMPQLPLTALDLSSNQLEANDGFAITNFLSKNTTLKKLFLSDNFKLFRDVRVLQSLKVILRSRQCAIEELHVPNCDIDEDGGGHIAQILHENASLQVLDASRNMIEKSGRLIAESLKENSTLTKLHLYSNRLGRASCCAIQCALQVNQHLVLRELRLEDNEAWDENPSTAIENVALQKVAGFLKLEEFSLIPISTLESTIPPKPTDGISEVANLNISPALLTLQSSKNLIEKLDLSDAQVGVSGAIVLAVLLRRNVYLRELQIANCNIQDEGARELANSLQKNDFLEKLDVGFNNITAKGCREIGEALSEKACKIKHLCVQHNHIDKEGFAVISAALETNECLLGLRIAGMVAPSSEEPGFGIEIVAEAMECNKTLLSLNLSYIPLNRTEVQALGDMLCKNQTLTALTLKFTGLSLDTGAQKFLESLTKNTGLEKLRIDNNKLESDGAKVLADVLAENDTLKFLDVRSNFIGADVALNECVRNNYALREFKVDGNNLKVSVIQCIEEKMKLNRESQDESSLTVINYNLCSQDVQFKRQGIISLSGLFQRHRGRRHTHKKKLDAPFFQKWHRHIDYPLINVLISLSKESEEALYQLQSLAESLFVLLPLLQSSIIEYLCTTRRNSIVSETRWKAKIQKQEIHYNLVVALMKMIPWGDSSDESTSYWKQGFYKQFIPFLSTLLQRRFEDWQQAPIGKKGSKLCWTKKDKETTTIDKVVNTHQVSKQMTTILRLHQERECNLMSRIKKLTPSKTSTSMEWTCPMCLEKNELNVSSCRKPVASKKKRGQHKTPCGCPRPEMESDFMKWIDICARSSVDLANFLQEHTCLQFMLEMITPLKTASSKQLYCYSFDFYAASLRALCTIFERKYEVGMIRFKKHGRQPEKGPFTQLIQPVFDLFSLKSLDVTEQALHLIHLWFTYSENFLKECLRLLTMNFGAKDQPQPTQLQQHKSSRSLFVALQRKPRGDTSQRKARGLWFNGLGFAKARRADPVQKLLHVLAGLPVGSDHADRATSIQNKAADCLLCILELQKPKVSLYLGRACEGVDILMEVLLRDACDVDLRVKCTLCLARLATTNDVTEIFSEDHIVDIVNRLGELEVEKSDQYTKLKEERAHLAVCLWRICVSLIRDSTNRKCAALLEAIEDSLTSTGLLATMLRDGWALEKIAACGLISSLGISASMSDNHASPSEWILHWGEFQMDAIHGQHAQLLKKSVHTNRSDLSGLQSEAELFELLFASLLKWAAPTTRDLLRAFTAKALSGVEVKEGQLTVVWSMVGQLFQRLSVSEQRQGMDGKAASLVTLLSSSDCLGGVHAAAFISMTKRMLPPKEQQRAAVMCRRTLPEHTGLSNNPPQWGRVYAYCLWNLTRRCKPVCTVLLKDHESPENMKHRFLKNQVLGNVDSDESEKQACDDLWYALDSALRGKDGVPDKYLLRSALGILVNMCFHCNHAAVLSWQTQNKHKSPTSDLFAMQLLARTMQMEDESGSVNDLALQILVTMVNSCSVTPSSIPADKRDFYKWTAMCVLTRATFHDDIDQWKRSEVETVGSGLLPEKRVKSTCMAMLIVASNDSKCAEFLSCEHVTEYRQFFPKDERFRTDGQLIGDLARLLDYTGLDVDDEFRSVVLELLALLISKGLDEPSGPTDSDGFQATTPEQKFSKEGGLAKLTPLIMPGPLDFSTNPQDDDNMQHVQETKQVVKSHTTALILALCKSKDRNSVFHEVDGILADTLKSFSLLQKYYATQVQHSAASALNELRMGSMYSNWIDKNMANEHTILCLLASPTAESVVLGLSLSLQHINKFRGSRIFFQVVRLLTAPSLPCQKVVLRATRVLWYFLTGSTQHSLLSSTETSSNTEHDYMSQRLRVATGIGRAEDKFRQYKAIEERYESDNVSLEIANRNKSYFDQLKTDLRSFFDDKREVNKRKVNKDDLSELRQTKHLSDSGEAIMNALRILIRSELDKCVINEKSKWYNQNPTNLQLLQSRSDTENYRGLLKVFTEKTLLNLSAGNIDQFEDTCYSKFLACMDANKAAMENVPNPSPLHNLLTYLKSVIGNYSRVLLSVETDMYYERALHQHHANEADFRNHPSRFEKDQFSKRAYTAIRSLNTLNHSNCGAQAKQLILDDALSDLPSQSRIRVDDKQEDVVLQLAQLCHNVADKLLHNEGLHKSSEPFFGASLKLKQENLHHRVAGKPNPRIRLTEVALNDARSSHVRVRRLRSILLENSSDGGWEAEASIDMSSLSNARPLEIHQHQELREEAKLITALPSDDDRWELNVTAFARTGSSDISVSWSRQPRQNRSSYQQDVSHYAISLQYKMHDAEWSDPTPVARLPCEVNRCVLKGLDVGSCIRVIVAPDPTPTKIASTESNNVTVPTTANKPGTPVIHTVADDSNESVLAISWSPSWMQPKSPSHHEIMREAVPSDRNICDHDVEDEGTESVGEETDFSSKRLISSFTVPGSMTGCDIVDGTVSELELGYSVHYRVRSHYPSGATSEWSEFSAVTAPRTDAPFSMFKSIRPNIAKLTSLHLYVRFLVGEFYDFIGQCNPTASANEDGGGTWQGQSWNACDSLESTAGLLQCLLSPCQEPDALTFFHALVDHTQCQQTDIFRAMLGVLRQPEAIVPPRCCLQVARSLLAILQCAVESTRSSKVVHPAFLAVAAEFDSTLDAVLSRLQRAQHRMQLDVIERMLSVLKAMFALKLGLSTAKGKNKSTAAIGIEPQSVDLLTTMVSFTQQGEQQGAGKHLSSLELNDVHFSAAELLYSVLPSVPHHIWPVGRMLLASGTSEEAVRRGLLPSLREAGGDISVALSHVQLASRLVCSFSLKLKSIQNDSASPISEQLSRLQKDSDELWNIQSYNTESRHGIDNTQAYLELSTFLNDDYDLMRSVASCAILCCKDLSSPDKPPPSSATAVAAPSSDLLSTTCKILCGLVTSSESQDFAQNNVVFSRNFVTEHIFNHEDLMQWQLRCLRSANKADNVIVQAVVLDLFAELMTSSTWSLRQLLLSPTANEYLDTIADALERKLPATASKAAGNPKPTDLWHEIERMQLAGLQCLRQIAKFQSAIDAINGRQRLWQLPRSGTTDGPKSDRIRMLHILLSTIHPAGGLYITVRVARAASDILAELCSDHGKIAQDINSQISAMEATKLFASHCDKEVHENLLRVLNHAYLAKTDADSNMEAETPLMQQLSNSKMFRAWLQNQGGRCSSVNLHDENDVGPDVQNLLDDIRAQFQNEAAAKSEAKVAARAQGKTAAVNRMPKNKVMFGPSIDLVDTIIPSNSLEC